MEGFRSQIYLLKLSALRGGGVALDPSKRERERGRVPAEVRDEIRGERGREGETRSLLSSGMRSEARDRERHGACCRRA